MHDHFGQWHIQLLLTEIYPFAATQIFLNGIEYSYKIISLSKPVNSELISLTQFSILNRIL